MVSEWKPVFPMGEIVLAGVSQNHWRDPSRKSRCKAVCLTQHRTTGVCLSTIGYNEHRKVLGNEEGGGGHEIALNGQGSQHFGDVAGQPEPTCGTEGILCSQQTPDSRWIHFGHGRDRQSVLVTLPS